MSGYCGNFRISDFWEAAKRPRGAPAWPVLRGDPLGDPWGILGDPGGIRGIFGHDWGPRACAGTHKTRLRRPSARSPGAGTMSPYIILLGDPPARGRIFYEFYQGQSALELYKSRFPASGGGFWVTCATGLHETARFPASGGGPYFTSAHGLRTGSLRSAEF